MRTPPACPEFEALIVRAADGAADATDGERLADHVATCAACQHALAAQRDARALLSARPPLEASPSFHVRVRQIVEEEHERSLANLLDFRRWTWRLAPIAVTLGIIAAVGVVRTSSAQAEAMSATAAVLPVSAALYSPTVSDASLLSLMLQTNVDDQLGVIEQDQR